jgi:hypothetical protein
MVSSRSVYTCARATVLMLAAFSAPMVAQAATIAVPAGGNLQAALNAANPGDTILLEPGATYVGNFYLPVHGGTSYVTLRTGGDPSLLPPAGVRMTPAYAPYLAKLQSPNTLPALVTKASAAYWTIMLVEFGGNYKGQGDVLTLGASNSQTTLSLVPHHLIVDRVYLHGDPVHGQKRGIALNSAETTIINSHLSDMKAVAQDTQAIAGWNGPGPFRIENNHLEAAGYPFILGGDDPRIANLVPSDLTFRGNLVRRPVEWKSAILPMPSGITTAGGGGGTLPAGSYGYRVVARRPAGVTWATSARSAEFTAAVVAGGSVTIRWTAVPDATEYRVYGRTAGGQTMFWKTTATSFTDTGAVGTSGSAPSSGTVWQVKNLFELKNARNVQIDSNVFENHWAQAQSGPSILFTVRNQYGGCTWCVVENITFEYNVVRNIGAGFHILGIDPNHPSQQTNNIRIRHNEVSGLDKTTWGGHGIFLQMGDNPRDIEVDHNTIISPSGGGYVTMSGPPIYDFKFTNNVGRHNSYGIIGGGYGPGNPSINVYLPNADIRRNVFAGGKASLYPADNFFPTIATFEAHFADYGVDYSLVPGTDWELAGTDGKDLGADGSGAMPDDPQPEPPDVITTALPATVELETYSASLQAAGGTSPYRWSIVGGTLPAGVMLDASGQISGAATTAGDYTFTVMVTDANEATSLQPLGIHVEEAIPPVEIVTTSLPGATATQSYSATLTATGGLGSYSWHVASGQLPSGVTLSSGGELQGRPAAMGTYTFSAQAQDVGEGYAVRTFVLVVAKAPNQAPAVWVSAPSGVVSVGAPVTLSATAADVDGLVTRVDFIINGRLVSSVGAAPFEVQWVARDGGPHVVTAIATDDADESATSAPASMSVTSEIVIYAGDVKKMSGNFQLVADATAADGQRLWNQNKGTPKLPASGAPASYAEFTFYAEAGRAYHVWMRGKADSNTWANDSAYLQFSGTVDAAGTPTFRIGTTAYTWYSLEEGSSVGVSGWGWQDNGFGVGVAGAQLYFEETGLQTLRIQQREDGLSIDQIVISPVRNLVESPGAAKYDTTIVSR